MSIYAMILLAVGLSADAFIVSVASGAADKRLGPRRIFKWGLLFGAAAVLAFVVGLLVNQEFDQQSLLAVKRLASVVLLVLGLQMLTTGLALVETSVDENLFEIGNLSMWKSLSLPIAANFDAIAVGAVLPIEHCEWLMSSIVIGIVTAAVSSLGFFLGIRGRGFAERPVELFGGMILTTTGGWGVML